MPENDIFEDEIAKLEDQAEGKKAKSISLAGLQPIAETDRLRFYTVGEEGDPEAEFVYFLDPIEMNAEQTGRLIRLQEKLTSAMSTLSKKRSEQAERIVEEATNGFVHFILPDIPYDDIRSLTLGQKMRIATFWNENNKTEDGSKN